MRKIFTLITVMAFSAITFAGSNATIEPVKPAKLNAADVMIPVGKDGKKISLLDLSQMKVKELEKITGAKMKLVDKVGFRVAQKQLRESIDADGTINSKKLNKFASRAQAPDGFNLGGFALGFLLGLIGVLIAYLISDDNKAARTKWAWIGFGVWVVLLLIFLVL